MKLGLYPKLAWTGIVKNRKLYYPYLLTCICMTAMLYIIEFLAFNESVRQIRGGGTITGTLAFGGGVIAFFSLLFLLYSGSFLIRRRNKEFGLYNILGMGKANIALILLWETLFSLVISLVGGLVLGILLSKLAELGLVNVVKGEVNFTLSVSVTALLRTVATFTAIFVIIYLRGLIRIGKTNAIALLRSENVGEKPPKANWVLGVIGIVLLIAAYIIAFNTRDPYSAFLKFFIAVLLVIAGTYLVFIAGSVMICRLLQKNKGYYYKPNHFVSVSSMVYRMKRNGAGLATICILATMVLVMISSTTCLYFGINDVVESRYPYDANYVFGLTGLDRVGDGTVDELYEAACGAAEKSGGGKVEAYPAALVSGRFENGTLYYELDYFKMLGMQDICTVYFVPLESYNSLMGRSETLEEDEVFVWEDYKGYGYDTFTVHGDRTYRVKAELDEMLPNGLAAEDITDCLFVVLPDFTTDLEYLSSQSVGEEFTGPDDAVLDVRVFMGFDFAEGESAVPEAIYDPVLGEFNEGVYSMRIDAGEANAEDYIGTFGGLLFLGICLSIVFIIAAILIIYYKQLSEGYEDRARFDIMQKIGMDKKAIKKSINSQLLTVFYLPLILAAMHMAFAFPMIKNMLRVFALKNVGLFAMTTLISFIVFALLYMIVYRVTAGTYYRIVSGAGEEKE